MSRRQSLLLPHLTPFIKQCDSIGTSQIMPRLNSSSNGWNDGAGEYNGTACLILPGRCSRYSLSMADGVIKLGVAYCMSMATCCHLVHCSSMNVFSVAAATMSSEAYYAFLVCLFTDLTFEHFAFSHRRRSHWVVSPLLVNSWRINLNLNFRAQDWLLIELASTHCVRRKLALQVACNNFRKVCTLLKLCQLISHQRFLL